MRRQQAILYQALTVPPPTYEKIPPSFGWFRPLEQPDRERVGAARRVLPVATMTAQETPWPYTQPAADNANTRWYVRLSEPQRFRGVWTRGYLQALLSGEIPFPAIQPALDARTTRWFQPLSEPRREYRFASRITGENPGSMFEANQPAAAPVFPDAYWEEWRVPVRYPRDPRYRVAFAAGETPWPYNQPAADNANTNWYQPFSLPVRFPRNPRYGATLDASGELKWPHNQPASDNANTRWFYPLSEPRREYRFVSRITGETPWPAVAGNPTGVFPSNWFTEWRLPQRALRNPRYGAAFAAGEFPWPYNQPADDNANARWFQPLSEPRREYRWIARAVGETPWSRIQPNPISMAWWKALEEPRRFLRNPRYSAVLDASGQAPWGQSPIAPPSPPLGTTRRALLRSGAFPTFWPGAS